MAQPKTTSSDIRKALHGIEKGVRNLDSVMARAVKHYHNRGAAVGGSVAEGVLAGPIQAPIDPMGPRVSLTRREIFDHAIQLAMQHGGDVDSWACSVLGAIQVVNKAQPELGQ